MFDVGFSEMVMIAVVALIVIGPEKLPKVARTLGLLAGRMQRYVSNVKSDIQREMQFEDLQKLQQEIKQGYEQTQTHVNEIGAGLQREVAALEREIDSSLVVDNTLREPAASAKPSRADQQELPLSYSETEPQTLEQVQTPELEQAAEAPLQDRHQIENQPPDPEVPALLVAQPEKPVSQ